ncbi:MAG: hypothetical protein GY804_01090 [Alphaproteobacteria bacterium]|nr:hypothetical protein [Alphaproteobacteria bacterium]
MNLLEIRTKFIDQSGRFNLVVDTINYADNGANFFIQAGQRYLDSVLPNRKEIGRYVKDISTNQTKLVMRYVRGIDSVYVKASGEDRVELDRKAYSWLLKEYGEDFGAKALGKATFTGQPTAEETFNVDAVTFTYKASGASGETEINLGSTVSETITNTVTILNANPVVNILVTTSQVSATEYIVEYKNIGTAGNAISFNNSLTNVTFDGSAFLGGTTLGRVTGLDTGTPTYFSSIQSLPSPQLTVNNMGSTETFELLFGTTKHKEDGILFLPPADGAYTMTVFGRFFSVLSDDLDTSYHSEMYPELLLMAASMALEVMYRNTQGVNDWLFSMDKWLRGADHDLAEEEIVLSGLEMKG